MAEPVIQIQNLSKQYRLGYIGAGTLSGDFQRWISKIKGKEDPFLKIGSSNQLEEVEGEYVWALQDINLEIEQGDVLGIIGKNGAGKSTLLKILSRVTGPTTGSIKVKGRIASLLEVGTGFHAELTGRENIFLNGAILGMKKVEIKSKFDEIVEFAGVAKYIDTPVKRYSSGMYVRLAFAVAAFLEPDILIVDEVLAVGDAEFQKKAIGKMKDVSQSEGRTVLFVSHNMASIETLCLSGILLSQGNIIYSGSAYDTVRSYLNLNRVPSNSLFINKLSPTNDVTMVSAKLMDKNGNLTENFTNEDDIYVQFEIYIKIIHPYLKVGFDLLMDEGNPLITSFHNDQVDDDLISLSPGNNNLIFKIPANILNKGQYSIRALATIHRVKWLYRIDNLLSFSVLFKLKNSNMPIDKKHSIIAPLIECKKINV